MRFADDRCRFQIPLWVNKGIKDDYVVRSFFDLMLRLHLVFQYQVQFPLRVM